MHGLLELVNTFFKLIISFRMELQLGGGRGLRETFRKCFPQHDQYVSLP